MGPRAREPHARAGSRPVHRKKSVIRLNTSSLVAPRSVSSSRRRHIACPALITFDDGVRGYLYERATPQSLRPELSQKERLADLTRLVDNDGVDRRLGGWR